MKLTTKDTVGLLLVVGTLGALLVHIGPDGHAAKHPLALTDGGGSATTAIENNTVAFVNVNVLPMNGEGVLANQVVVVEGGFVRRIGPVGEVSVPIDALQIDGYGTQFVMPGLTDAHVHLVDDARDWLPLFVRRFVHEDASFGTVTLGARADLLLLDQNPLLDLSGLRQPRGVMLRGEWFDRAALDTMLDKAGDSR